LAGELRIEETYVGFKVVDELELGLIGVEEFPGSIAQNLCLLLRLTTAFGPRQPCPFHRVERAVGGECEAGQEQTERA